MTRAIRAVTALAAALAVTTSATAATPRPAGHRPASGTFSTVPWQRVGPGWTLATWSPRYDGRATLFLLDAAGHRWTIARNLPRFAQVRQWSPDGRRALLDGGLSSRPLVVDLHTGRHRTLGAKNSYGVGFSRPRGLAVLVNGPGRYQGRTVERLQRFGLAGRRQLTYPSVVRGAGDLDTYGALENATGTALVLGAQHGLVLLRNDGSTVRRLLPSVTGSCDVDSWWRPGVALASCNGLLFGVPVSGAKAFRLSGGHTHSAPFGYSSAWRYSRGRLGLARSGCGPQYLVRFGPRGNGTPVHLPSPTARRASAFEIAGHQGDIVLVNAVNGCSSSHNSLYRWNAATGRMTARLLGAPVTSGTATSGVAYPTR